MSKLIRLTGFVIMLDGLMSAAFGHASLHWLRSRTPRRLHGLLEAFEHLPQPLFRIGALLQAAAGAHLLAHGALRRKHPGGPT